MANQESKIKKILGSKATLFFLLLAFVWLAVNLVNVYYKRYKLNEQVNALKAEIEKSQQDKQQISAMIDYLGTQSFLEKQAREKLNMKAPGEQVVIVEPSDNSSTSAPVAAPATGQDLVSSGAAQKTSSGVAQNQSESNLAKWWRYFFH